MGIVVLGAGSWGTALAKTIAHENQYLVSIWDRRLGGDRRFATRLEWKVDASPIYSLGAIRDYRIVILAVPISGFREVCMRLDEEGVVDEETILVGTCKGIEEEPITLPGQIVLEVFGKGKVLYGHLGGPGFAKGLLKKEDTRLVIASEIREVLEEVPRVLNNDFLHVQQTDDLIGLEVAGATRTSLSIVMGAAYALGFHRRKNTMAALFGRALAENVRLAQKLGGRVETFADVAGAGDLFLCADPESRNFLLGKRIVREVPEDWPCEVRIKVIREIVEEIGTVEGYQTCKALYFLAQKQGIDMPWVEAVYQVCHLGRPVSEVIEKIRQRHLKEA